MTDLHQRKRPGVAFAGFLVPFALQMAVVLGYRENYFASLGWHGGEYAYAFIWIVFGTILLGCVLKFLRPPWNSVGTGVVLGGTVGVLIALGAFALVMIALSRTPPVF